LKRGTDAIEDFFHFADTRNADEFWCPLIAARRPPRVVLYQRLGLMVVDLEALFHRFFLVGVTSRKGPYQRA
jgi:hypothetical protein